MLWVMYAVLTALTWAVVAVVDKYAASKWFKNPLVSTTALGIVSIIASATIYAVHGYATLSKYNQFLAFISGTAYVLAVVFYFKAVKVEEISRVVPLVYLSPLFIMILAGAILGEIFSLAKYLGIILLIAGAILISSKDLLKLRFGKAFWFMVASSAFIAINAVITKYLLQSADFWTVLSYTRGIGMVPAMIPVFFYSYKDMAASLNKYGSKAAVTLYSKEALRFGGGLLITLATSLGPVTLVNALSSVQPFFVLVLTLLLSTFYPKIMKEETGRFVVMMKAAAIILMFLGAILIL